MSLSVVFDIVIAVEFASFNRLKDTSWLPQLLTSEWLLNARTISDFL